MYWQDLNDGMQGWFLPLNISSDAGFNRMQKWVWFLFTIDHYRFVLLSAYLHIVLIVSTSLNVMFLVLSLLEFLFTGFLLLFFNWLNCLFVEYTDIYNSWYIHTYPITKHTESAPLALLFSEILTLELDFLLLFLVSYKLHLKVL